MKNKRFIRLTEADLHRIVKRSVNKVLMEGEAPSIDPRNMGVVRAVRNLVRELEKVGADDSVIEKAQSIEWDFVQSYGDDGFDDSFLGTV